MKKFESKEAAMASQNFDPTQVVITGVPEEHAGALKAFAILSVVHDAVNEKKLAFTDGSPKYSAYHRMGSPSGVGFAAHVYGHWRAGSHVGARLSSESWEAAEHIVELCPEEYKAMKVYDRKVD